MTVKHILNEKGRNVVSIDEAASVTDAVQLLTERRIGALVCVASDGSLLGIVSERDIVRMIARDGAAALDTPLSNVMTRSVTTVSETTTIEEALEQMTRGRFRHLPIIEGGKLVGLISIGDAVKSKIETAEREAAEMRSYIATA